MSEIQTEIEERLHTHAPQVEVLLAEVVDGHGEQTSTCGACVCSRSSISVCISLMAPSGTSIHKKSGRAPTSGTAARFALA